MGFTEPVEEDLRRSVPRKLVADALLPSLARAARASLQPNALSARSLALRAGIEAALRSAAVIGANDPRVFDVVRGFDGETLTVRIRGVGACGTIQFHSNSVSFIDSFTGRSSLTVLIDSPELLWMILERKCDPAEAYTTGKISYAGESGLIAALAYLLLRCGDYLPDIRRLKDFAKS
jgi:hypothetical protein